MAKKDKAPQVEAPVVEAPKAEEASAATVVDMTAKKGLTQGEKLQFATELRHRVTELKEEENPPLALIAGYNMIRDTTFIDLAAGEIACGASAMGFIFSGNEIAYKALQAAAASLGVSLPEFKALPAPSDKDLKAVGLRSVDSTTKLITIKDKDVSDEAKKKKKAEKKINDDAASGKKEYLEDHTKIETEDQLKEALGFQLVNLKIASPIDRLITTAQFYRSYLEAHAEKANDPQAELAKIHGYSLSDLLQDIVTMVPPSFALEGFGKHLSKLVISNKSVVPAFDIFKKAATNRKTNVCKFSDDEIATLVRLIVIWNSTANIASISKDLKVLNKDAEKNAKAIAQCGEKIKYQQDTISLVSEPDFDIADNFIAAYKNNEHENHKLAVTIYNSIMDTYYPGVDIPELELDSALLNVQQRVGIILNAFNSPLGKREEYSVDNLIDITGEEKASEGEKEDEEKNS